MSDLHKSDLPTDEPPMSVMEEGGETAQNTTDNKITTVGRSVFYWVVLATTIVSFIFFTGSISSCKSFSYNHYSDPNQDLVYGYRGFIHNETGKCTDWNEFNDFNEYWIQRLQTLFYMGIAGAVLCVIAVGLWILEGTCGIANATKKLIEASSTSGRRPRRCCPCHLIPTIFAVLFGLFGMLAFVTLIGNCDNIPPLSPGGLGCDFSVWSSLGMFASISSCITGITICGCYRRRYE